MTLVSLGIEQMQQIAAPSMAATPFLCLSYDMLAGEHEPHPITESCDTTTKSSDADLTLTLILDFFVPLILFLTRPAGGQHYLGMPLRHLQCRLVLIVTLP